MKINFSANIMAFNKEKKSFLLPLMLFQRGIIKLSKIFGKGGNTFLHYLKMLSQMLYVRFFLL